LSIRNPKSEIRNINEGGEWMAGMVDLIFEREAANLALLHQELATALGPRLVGVSADGRGLRVHLLDSTTSDERKLAGQIVTGHDAARLTADQQAERERGAALGALRKPWSQWSAADKDALLRLLAGELGLAVL
jgi:hypothetical protein